MRKGLLHSLDVPVTSFLCEGTLHDASAMISRHRMPGVASNFTRVVATQPPGAGDNQPDADQAGSPAGGGDGQRNDDQEIPPQGATDRWGGPAMQQLYDHDQPAMEGGFAPGGPLGFVVAAACHRYLSGSGQRKRRARCSSFL